MANEKRLIKMCDATKVYNGIALYMAENAYLNDTALDVLKKVASWLNDAPTVDAVEVVRCYECKKNGNDEECPLLSMMQYTEDDDSCSMGERREGE